jgi:hypothetical protein
MSNRNGNGTGTDAEQLRELIRSAHETIKDLRAAIREAREIPHAIDRDAIYRQVDAIAAERAGVYTAAVDRAEKEAAEVSAALREHKSEIDKLIAVTEQALRNAASNPERAIAALNMRPLPAIYVAGPGAECSWCDCEGPCVTDTDGYISYPRHNLARCAGCDEAAAYIVTGISASPKAVCGRHMEALRADANAAVTGKRRH